MNHNLKLLAVAAIALNLTGCFSPGPKKVEPKQDSVAAAVDGDQPKEVDSQEPKDPLTTETPTVPQGPTTSTNNELYKKFNDARAAKNNHAAQEAAGEILSRDPNDFKVLNALATMAIEQERFDRARLLLSKILDKDPANSAAHNNLGIIELRENNLSLALIQFKKALEGNASNKSAHANLGIIYLQYRNYPNAVTELDAATSMGDQSPGTLSNLAYALTGAGDYQKAKSVYEKASSKDPSNLAISFNYAVLLVEHTDDKKDAIKLLNKIRFVSHDSVILSQVDALIKKAESGPKKNSGSSETEKGDSD